MGAFSILTRLPCWSSQRSAWSCSRRPCPISRRLAPPIDPENALGSLRSGNEARGSVAQARALGVCSTRVGHLEGAFTAMAAKPVGAFVTMEEPVQTYNVEASARLAKNHRLAGCGCPEFALAGGFVGYWVDFLPRWRQAATFVDNILKGAKPADLPVERATTFLTIVNAALSHLPLRASK